MYGFRFSQNTSPKSTRSLRYSFWQSRGNMDAKPRVRGYSQLMLRSIFLFSFVLLFSVPGKGIGGEPVTVFAAASTQQAVDAVLATCKEKIGTECRAVFAASSTLARQIASSAPADIFISANQKWMRYLSDNAFVVPESTRVISRNKLIVIAPTSSAMTIKTADDLIHWLRQDRIALGDPDHVPAGIYAKQALNSLGVWDQLRTKTLRMPNVRAALAVVARGEANAGIVYATDAVVSPDVKVVYTFAPETHTQIDYPMALVKGRDSDAVKRVFALFSSPQGRAAFKKAGFNVENGS